MKALNNLIACFLSAVFLSTMLSSCMTDREYQLRKHQLDNQASHPTTYDLFSVEGPIKIEIAEGGKAKVTVPNQPFKEISIPDGVKTQADLIKHLISVGAISVVGWRAIDDASDGAKTYNTTNNNAAVSGE